MEEETEFTLTATAAQVDQLEVACNGCDFGECEDEIYKALESELAEREAKIDAAGRFKWWKCAKERREAKQIRQVLRNEKRFAKYVDYVMFQSKQALVDSGRLSEFGDGEFMQWWWEWFSDGGMEKLVEFIGAIFKIIMTVISNAWLAMALAGLILIAMMGG